MPDDKHRSLIARLRNWRFAALIPLTALSSALLCLWLAHALLDRNVRTGTNAVNGIAVNAYGQAVTRSLQLVDFLLARAAASPVVGAASVSDAPLDGIAESFKELMAADGMTSVSLFADADNGVKWTSGTQMHVPVPLFDALRAASPGRIIASRITEDGTLMVGTPVLNDTVRAGALIAQLSLSVLAARVQLPLDAGGVAANPPGQSAVSLRLAGSPDAGAGEVDKVARINFHDQMIMLGVTPREPTEMNSFWPLAWRLLIASGLVSLVLAALLQRWLGASGARKTDDLRVADALTSLRRGNFEARTGISIDEDPHGIGPTLDRLLDERQDALDHAVRQHDELTAALAQLVGGLTTMTASRDLSVRLPSSTSLTRELAEAVNGLTAQAGRSLSRMAVLSERIAHATASMRAHGERVANALRDERHAAQRACEQLSDSATRVGAVAGSIELGNVLTDQAVESGARASGAVQEIKVAVRRARDRVRQTEKRIKGLGERSQEISTTVRNIASLADRTGIVALNASLQAAAAGESGRQFAVLADEVKRLADSARDATDQIAAMVQAIQVETVQAVGAMNDTISEVVSISQLANDGAAEVAQCERHMRAWSDIVRGITAPADGSVVVADAVQQGVADIEQSGSLLTDQIRTQLTQTDHLVADAQALVKEISAFITPASTAAPGVTAKSGDSSHAGAAGQAPDHD